MTTGEKLVDQVARTGLFHEAFIPADDDRQPFVKREWPQHGHFHGVFRRRNIRVLRGSCKNIR